MVTDAPPAAGAWRSRALALVFTAVGALSVAALVGWAGADAVASALRRAGWLFIPIAALHILPVALDALAWRIVAPQPRPPLRALMAARWLREGVNAILPAARIGGEVAAVRVLARAGYGAAASAGAVALDVMAEFVALAACGVAGAALLVALAAPAMRGGAWAVLAAATPAVAIAGLLVFLARSPALAGLARRVATKWPRLGGPIEAALASASTAWWRPGVMLGATGVHALAWVAGGLETWAILAAIGHPVSPVAAFALETTSEVIKSFGFAAPGLMAAQEGGVLLVGALLGVPAADALALSLFRRGRDIALGIAALLAWRRMDAAVAGRGEPILPAA